MQRTSALLALALLAACAEPTGPPLDRPVGITANIATPVTFPAGTIHKYYTVGGRAFAMHILPRTYRNMLCQPDVKLSKTVEADCAGGGGGGGNYRLASSCSSPGASMECAMKALGLTIQAGTIAGSCGASWTGVAAVACGALIVGFGNSVTGYLQTPDCRACPPPLAYPTLRPAPGFTGWEEF